MGAIIAGLIIGAAAAIIYGITRNMGRKVTLIAMIIVCGILALILRSCIFG